ncbi:choice-of-anchor Q domain-containing protein [Roseimaritima ulvae]|uniref:choice-of-anchor Q domain-containing protein n=1 Tax=Roseimaritima ulvae TaxID=980254 RepID=UPI0008367C2B|nr:choice-of-anchor Q domain-containing protein [Roseimaritima ulvae]
MELVDNATISDLTQNPLVNPVAPISETYLLERSRPRVETIRRFDPIEQVTNADQVRFLLFVSEPIENVDNSDFRLTGTASSNARMAAVQLADPSAALGPPGLTYVATVDGLDNSNGTLGLEVQLGSDIVDTLGNAIEVGPASIENQEYIIENVRPIPTFPLSSLTYRTNDPIQVNLTFSEDVFGFEPTEPMVQNAAVTYFSGGPREFMLELTPTAPLLDQTITFQIPEGVAVDGDGNPNTLSRLASWQPQLDFDFGDAPDRYKTLDSSGGPKHVIDAEVFLGGLIPDSDPDGFGSLGTGDSGDAMADDNDDFNNNDEDGWLGLRSVSLNAIPKVEVQVTNKSSEAATLAGWIDYDQNGSFDPSEYGMVDIPAGTEGQNVTLEFPRVPTDVSLGTTFARLRITTDNIDSSTPGGFADDGEVEDYQVSIVPEQGANLSITATTDPYVQAGSNFEYTVRVENPGPEPADDVTITYALPAGTQFVGGSDANWTCDAASGIVTCQHGSLGVLGTLDLAFTITSPLQNGTFTNDFSVSSTTADSDNTNNTASASTTLTGPWVRTADDALWFLDFGVGDQPVWRAAMGEEPVDVGGLAVRIGLALDGTVLVQNEDGAVFTRPGSADGIGATWKLLDAVTAGDGSTWFLGPDGPNTVDKYIYRWVSDEQPVYSDGFGVSLVADDGIVLTQNSLGAIYQRVGSDTGLGSIWQLTTVGLSAPDENAQEGGDTATYRLSRANVGGAMTVNLAVAGASSATIAEYQLHIGNGPAIDLSTGSFSVTIPADKETLDITLTAQIDATDEAETSETVLLNLLSGDYLIDSSASTASATIGQNGFLVTTDADAGTGSLRQAVLNANATAGANSITFGDGSSSGGTNFLDATPDTILLNSELVITEDLTVTGNGASSTILDGQESTRLFNIPGSAGDVTLQGLTFTRGQAPANDAGGAIANSANLQIDDSVFTANVAYLGAAINSDASLTVRRSSFLANQAGFNGGAIRVFGSATISESTFAGNSASNGGGAIINHGSLRLANATFTDNQADTGGAIENFGAGTTATVTNATIHRNTATSAGGGIRNVDGTTTVNNTIIIGNHSAVDPDVGGSFSSNAANIIGDVGSSSGFGSEITGVVASAVIDVNLADNGGPTQTHALIAGSPAIDAGNNTNATQDGMAGGTALVTDQRGPGFARIRNSTVDMGAFETTPPPGVELSLSHTTGSEAGATVVVATATADKPVVGNQTVDVMVTGTDITSADFDTLTRTITILDGQTTGQVDFTVQDDSVVEALTETATISLINPSGGLTLGASNNSATMQITDNDTASLSVNDVNVNESDGTITFTITSTLEASKDIQVEFNTTSGTASEGTDFDSGDQDVTLTAGQTSVDVIFNITDDATVELDETFDVALSNARFSNVADPFRVMIGNGTAVGTITDDDENLVAINVAPDTLAEDDAATVRLTRNNVFGTLTVNLTRNGTSTAADSEFELTVGANPPIDVSGGNFSVTFPDGDPTLDITLTALTDATDEAEADETITLDLATGNYVIDGSANTAAVTIAQNGFLVTTDTDGGTGSLRQAVLNANAIPGPDTITFGDGSASGGTNFLDAAPDTMALNLGELTITEDLTITGNGASSTILDGQESTRLFNIPGSAGDVTLQGLTFTRGQTPASDAGGAILNSANLQIVDSVFTANVAFLGAAINSDGALTVRRSSFLANQAGFNGGAVRVFGSATISESTFAGNSASNGGGAIINYGNLLLANATFTDNQADLGGAIENFGSGTTATITNTTIHRNTATLGGGIHNNGGTATLQNTIVAGSPLAAI